LPFTSLGSRRDAKNPLFDAPMACPGGLPAYPSLIITALGAIFTASVNQFISPSPIIYLYL
jgi:hypothetical protein